MGLESIGIEDRPYLSLTYSRRFSGDEEVLLVSLIIARTLSVRAPKSCEVLKINVVDFYIGVIRRMLLNIRADMNIIATMTKSFARTSPNLKRVASSALSFLKSEALFCSMRNDMKIVRLDKAA